MFSTIALVCCVAFEIVMNKRLYEMLYDFTADIDAFKTFQAHLEKSDWFLCHSLETRSWV